MASSRPRRRRTAGRPCARPCRTRAPPARRCRRARGRRARRRRRRRSAWPEPTRIRTLLPMATPRIVIIGAGFGGLGTAIELQRHGFTDIVVLEKADRIGGVWRDNTYPNAACDVPSNLYSWSFARNPTWGHRY